MQTEEGEVKMSQVYEPTSAEDDGMALNQRSVEHDEGESKEVVVVVVWRPRL